jgi:putative membrane protein
MGKLTVVVAGALALAPLGVRAEQPLPAEPPKIDIPQQKVNPAKSDLSVTDRKFVEKAASDHLDEIELSKLAQQKSSSEAVKRLAGQVIEEHEKALRRLRTIANEHNFPIPTSPTTATSQDYQRLAALSGEKFDEEYLRLVKKHHDQAIDDFQKASSTLQNDDLKRYAVETLPTLKEHKSDVENLKK